VVVLAGSDAASPPAGARAADAESPLADKAFVPLRGRLVIQHVLDFLSHCGCRRVHVVAPAQQLARLTLTHSITPVPSRGGSFFESLLAGSQAVAPAADEPVLLVFGDHPVNSVPAFRWFLRCTRDQIGEADLFHAFALQASYRDYAPWFERTAVHLREMCGRASGWTVVVPSRLHGLSQLKQLYDVRKLDRLGVYARLVRHLVGRLGKDAPRCLADSCVMYTAKEMQKAGRGSTLTARAARRLEAWLADRVPIRRTERYAARILGAERGVRLVPIAHGGIAIDVDFAGEFATLDEHWDAIHAIAARQDEALIGAESVMSRTPSSKVTHPR
jgi:hypothetical protein